MDNDGSDIDFNALYNDAKKNMAKEKKDTSQDSDPYKELREEAEHEDNIVNNKERDVKEDTKKDTEEDILIKHNVSEDDNPNMPNIEGRLSQKDLDEYPQPKISEYDEQIFPGGPLTSEIAKIKKMYEDCTLYEIHILDKHFVIKTLNRHEYKQIVEIPKINALLREEIICSTCVLWPYEYNWREMATGEAGIPSKLAKVIMSYSGFTDDYEIQVL